MQESDQQSARICTAAPATCKTLQLQLLMSELCTTALAEIKTLRNCNCRVQDYAQLQLQSARRYSEQLHQQSARLGATASPECKTLHSCTRRVQDSTAATVLTPYSWTNRVQDSAQLHKQSPGHCTTAPLKCKTPHNCTSRWQGSAQQYLQMAGLYTTTHLE